MEWNGHSNPAGMESLFHYGQNGMSPFHSGWNGMSSSFLPEWNDHSIPDRMEWPYSIPTGMEWAFHSDWIAYSNPDGLECHSFDNLKKSAPSIVNCLYWPYLEFNITWILVNLSLEIGYIFFNKNSYDSKYFLTQIFLKTNISCVYKMFLVPKYFLDPIFLGA